MEKIKRRRWEDKEIEYLRDNHTTILYKDIGKYLNRTKRSVVLMSIRIGLKTGPRKCYAVKNPNWKGGVITDTYHYRKIQIERYPQKEKARKAVRQAVRSGRLYKPYNCSECKKTFSKNKIEGHHEDYDKPLEVRWLCRRCHKKLDKK